MDAIVFDWDGTLVDSFEPLYRSNVAVLASYGIDVDEASYRRSYTPDWRQMYLDLGVPCESIEESAQRWRDAYLGDVLDDMRMARTVGAHAVGIVGRLGTPDELFEAGAHAIHHSVVEWLDPFLDGRP